MSVQGLSPDELFRHALGLQGAGRIAEAEGLYRQVLAHAPDHANAMFLLGICRHIGGDHDAALRLMDRAIALAPEVPSAHYNRGKALQDIGRLEEAVTSYGNALALDAGYTAALRNRANALLELDRPDDALADLDRLVALAPADADAWCQRANLLQRMQRPEEAIGDYRHALACQPGHFKALNNLGVALQRLDRLEDAIRCLREAVALKPDYAEAYSNLGMALHRLQRDAEAIDCYRKAVELRPDYVEAYYNLGISLHDLSRFGEAIACYDRALALHPGLAEAHNNRGLSLQELGHHEEALGCYDRAVALDSGYAEAHANRGAVLELLYRPDEALAAFATAMSLDKGMPYLQGQWLHAKMLLCDWQGLDEALDQVAQAVRRGEPATNPFPALSFRLDAEEQALCAARFVGEKYPPHARPLWHGERARHDRIRVAYVSSDFRNHAVSYLLAGVLERHDRSRFEIHALSTGAYVADAMHERIKRACEHFVDLRGRSDEECALTARRLEVDICVDLNGYTLGGRPGMFARRPAPIQVNYLGYPGSMAVEYIDYILADRIVIPEEQRRHYKEHVVYLPHCFQANDDSKAISDSCPSRADLGLPERGFVFCSFNNTYKLTPDLFEIWMRLLRAVDGSVLWLAETNAAASRNLRREARMRGIAEDRLVFARRVPLPEYLAQYRLADLFLDTFYYNAGTTASDALWAGLPVLSCLGDTFARRMAASLLNAIGLPELITDTPQAYEALALDLALDPGALAGIREKLAVNRKTYPLFDTSRFTRHIEQAYLSMWERHQAGLPIEDIRISP